MQNSLSNERIAEIAANYFHQDDTELADIKAAIRAALYEAEELAEQSRPTPEQSGEARDAARYRWLRDSGRGLLLCRCDDGSLRYALTDGPAPMNWYATPDAAIDAAMDRSALGRES